MEQPLFIWGIYPVRSLWLTNDLSKSNIYPFLKRFCFLRNSVFPIVLCFAAHEQETAVCKIDRFDTRLAIIIT